MKRYLPVALALVALGTAGTVSASARPLHRPVPGQLYMYAPDPPAFGSAAAPFAAPAAPQVIIRGKVIGQDPDPQIRTQLSRGYSASSSD